MNALNPDITQAFDAYAGAVFGLWGVLDPAPANDAVRFAHVLALRGHALSLGWPEAADWANSQIAALAASAPGEPLRCLPGLRDHWSVWAADALRNDRSNLELQKGAIETAFAGVRPGRDERAAVARLLIAVLAQRHALFEPASLPGASAEKFSSPDACVCVQIGIALRALKDEGGPQAALIEEWRGIMLNAILRKLPGRAERGFAPGYPLFEDVVLAFLHVAQWLERPNAAWIRTYVADCQSRPHERLTPDQLAFGGYLLGFLRGYKKLGAAVQDRPLRAWLSRQALACALQRQPGSRESALLTALTPGGRWTELTRPLARLASLERTESQISVQTGDGAGWQVDRKIVDESVVIKLDEVLTVRLRCGVKS